MKNRFCHVRNVLQVQQSPFHSSILQVLTEAAMRSGQPSSLLSSLMWICERDLSLRFDLAILLHVDVFVCLESVDFVGWELDPITSRRTTISI